MNLLDLPTEILLQIFHHAAGQAALSVASLLGFTGKRENVLTTLALVSRKCQEIAYKSFYGTLAMTNDRAKKFYRSLDENPRLQSLVVSYQFINCDLAHLRSFYRSIYSLPIALSSLQAIHSPMVATISSLVDHELLPPPPPPIITAAKSTRPSNAADSIPIRTLTLSSVHPIRDIPKLIESRSTWMNTSELDHLVMNFTPINLAPTLPLRSTDPFYSQPTNPMFPQSLRSLTLGNPIQGLEPNAILPILKRLPNLVKLAILGPSAPDLKLVLEAVPGLETAVFTRAPRDMLERSLVGAKQAENRSDREAEPHRALRQIEILSPNETRLIESFNKFFLDLIPSLRSFDSSARPAFLSSAYIGLERQNVQNRLDGLPALETVRLAGLAFNEVRASSEGTRRVSELAVVLKGWGIQLVDQEFEVW